MNKRAGASGVTFGDEAAENSGVDPAFFGEVVPSNVIKAKQESIFKVVPDYQQPRRTMPAAIRGQWDGTAAAASMAHVFKTWIEFVNQERQTDKQPPLDIATFFETTDEVADRTVPSRPVEAWLLDVIRIAITIHHKGLNEPLIGSYAGDLFYIEQGERRWLAHHFLYWFFKDQKWSKVYVRTEKSRDVWRQAIENGARENLNAIALARQLALLIMDVYEGMGAQFKSYMDILGEGGTDRDFYAQVADGEKYRIPRGMSDRFLAATGLKDAVQLRQHRALLGLSDELWSEADLKRLPEGAIRQLAKGKPQSDTVTIVTVSKIAGEIKKQFWKYENRDEQQIYLDGLKAAVTDLEAALRSKA